MAITPTRAVKVPVPEYEILVEHARKTGKRLQALLARAIQRCYGNGKEGQ